MSWASPANWDDLCHKTVPGQQKDFSVFFRMLLPAYKLNKFFIANLFYAIFKATLRS